MTATAGAHNRVAQAFAALGDQVHYVRCCVYPAGSAGDLVHKLIGTLARSTDGIDANPGLPQPLRVFSMFGPVASPLPVRKKDYNDIASALLLDQAVYHAERIGQ